MRVLIVAGGTGGHISPGVALVQEFVRRGVETAILTLRKNEKYPDIGSAGVPVLLYNAPPFPSSILSLIRYPFRMLGAFLYAFRALRTFDCLIGLGGYPTIPALMAAVVRRKQIYLCEQNAVPGQVTRLFSRFASAVFLSFPIERRIPRSELVGNPVRSQLIANRKRNPQIGLILVLGGSQGARQINQMLTSLLLDENRPWTKDATWLIQCGESHLESMREMLGARENVTLFGFHSSIQELYAKAAVLISRSGAGILTEGTLFGLPLVLIPLPTSKDDHQRANARVAEAAGAAIMIDQNDADHQRLADVLGKLLTSPEILEDMSRKSAALFAADAASRIAERVLA